MFHAAVELARYTFAALDLRCLADAVSNEVRERYDDPRYDEDTEPPVRAEISRGEQKSRHAGPKRDLHVVPPDGGGLHACSASALM